MIIGTYFLRFFNFISRFFGFLDLFIFFVRILGLLIFLVNRLLDFGIGQVLIFLIVLIHALVGSHADLVILKVLNIIDGVNLSVITEPGTNIKILKIINSVEFAFLIEPGSHHWGGSTKNRGTVHVVLFIDGMNLTVFTEPGKLLEHFNF